MISSSITGITIKDSPVQVFSINGAKDLTLNEITIDDSAGDAGGLGHNTDAFDVGSSTGVTISGANVKNQDDCLAINSGTVCPHFAYLSVHFHANACYQGYRVHWRYLLRWSWSLDRLRGRSRRQHCL